ncbi:hypothetical protein K3495_g330 [Podosphaera aphanis]|nr:hypothetical protein K3495_g330 [Podosphaera aphanis]
MSRIQRAYRQLPEAETAHQLTVPTYLGNLGTKESEKAAYKRWLSKIPSSEICAYPDGSSEDHGRSAWAFVLKKGDKTLLSVNGTLHGGEVLDAEIVEARKAIEVTLRFSEKVHVQLRPGERAQRIHIFTDSQHARKALLTGNSLSSLEDVRTFRTLAQQAHEQVQVNWVPGHSGIRENEEADTAARGALRNLPDRDTPPESCTTANLYRLMNRRRQALLDKFWEESCPPWYRELDLLMRRRKPPELSLSRRLLLELIVASTGHGDFAAHHRRFNNPKARMECLCGEETNPTQFINYQRHAHILRRLRGAMTSQKFVKKLLGPNCHKSFTTFALETGYFRCQPANLSTALSVEQE